MITMEEKIDIILQYIATDDPEKLKALREEAADALETDPNTNTDADIIDVIENLIKEAGVPTSLRGHDYLVYAIKLAVSDRKYVLGITTLTYPEIAACFNSTAQRVERGIRHAIEVAFDRGDIEDIRRLFGNTISLNKGKTTNKEFISACAKEVERRLRTM